METDKRKIANFLFQFKFFASSGGFTHIEREKNLNTQAELGLTVPQIEEIILGLTYCDYFKGPEKDKNYPKQNIWGFGCNVNGCEIYIKLSDDFSHNIAKCISFHIAERALDYPYKSGGKK